MDASQRQALDDCMPLLADNIQYEALKLHLKKQNILSSSDFDVIEYPYDNPSREAKVVACLQLLKTKDDGFSYLPEFFALQNQSFIWTKLYERYFALKDETSKQAATQSAASFEAADIESDVERLRDYLISEYTSERFTQLKLFPSCDSSGGNLPIDKTYVTLHMVRQEETSTADDDECFEVKSTRHMMATGRISDNARLLSFLFSKGDEYKNSQCATTDQQNFAEEERETPKPLIITGDPGQGKTTFVQKLSYDWAMAHKGDVPNPCLKAISLLFAFTLRNLKGTFERISDFLLLDSLFQHSDDLRMSLPGCKEWIRQNPMKTLAVLDGLDELSATCTQLDNVFTKRPPHVPDFPLIITTRPYAVPEKCIWPLRFEICALQSQQAQQIIANYAGGGGLPRSVQHQLLTYCEAEENAFLFSSPLLLYLLCGTVLSTFERSPDRKIRLPRSQTQLYVNIVEWIYIRSCEKRTEGKSKTVFFLRDWLEKDVLCKRLSKLAFSRTFTETLEHQRLIFEQCDVYAALDGDYFYTTNTQVVSNTEQASKSPDRSSLEPTAARDAMQIGYLIADSIFYGCYESLATNFKITFAHKTFQEFFAAIQIVLKFDDVDNTTEATLFAQERKGLLVRNKQAFLFSIGIASEIAKARAVKTTTLPCCCPSFIFEQPSNAIDIINFLVALLREATVKTMKDALSHWVQANMEQLENFLECKVDADMEKPQSNSLLIKLAEFLLPLNGNNLLLLEDISGRSFLSGPLRNGKPRSRTAVCEIDGVDLRSSSGQPVLKFSAKRHMADINRLRIDGTAKGIETFLRTHSMACSSSRRRPSAIAIHVTQRPQVVPAALWKHDAKLVKNEMPKTASSKHDEKYQKLEFNRVHLYISSMLNATDVTTMMKIVSETQCDDDRLTIHCFDETDVFQTSQTGGESSMENSEVAGLSTVRKISDFSLVDANPNRFIVKLILSCAEHIKSLSLNEATVQLIQDVGLLDEAYTKLTVAKINYVHGMLKPVLAKLASQLKARQLEITLINFVDQDQFDAFCTALIEEGASLIDFRIRGKSSYDNTKILFAAISDSLKRLQNTFDSTNIQLLGSLNRFQHCLT